MRENQQGARALLQAAQLADAAVAAVWARLPESYFLRYRPEEIAHHTQVLARPDAGGEAARVAVEAQPDSGTTAILMYAPHRPHSFAGTTAALDQLGLNIVDARITPVGAGILARYLPRARGGRHAHHRSRAPGRDRACALVHAAARLERTAGGLAPRAAPAARVPYPDADRHQHRRAQRALGARTRGRRPARIAVRHRQGACGKSASTWRPPGSAPWESAPRTSSTSPMRPGARLQPRRRSGCASDWSLRSAWPAPEPARGAPLAAEP